MPLPRTLRHNRLIALIAALVMVMVICGYSAHEPAAAGTAQQPCHCDWTLHFSGMAGSAPPPVPTVKPVLAGWRLPPVAAAAPHGARRLRSHPARGPPLPLSIG